MDRIVSQLTKQMHNHMSAYFIGQPNWYNKSSSKFRLK